MKENTPRRSNPNKLQEAEEEEEGAYRSPLGR